MRLALDQFRHDAKFALRQLAGARSFTVAAVATLAIGIGATAAVFSLLNAVVLRPLPFDEPDRVVNLHPARDGIAVGSASGLEFATWRALSSTFAATAAYIPQSSFVLDRGTGSEVVNGTRASADILRAVGVRPELGRGFTAADDIPGAPRVALLGHKLWVDDFRSDRAIVGQSIRLDNEVYTVIGVLPTSVDQISGGAALWTPLALSSDDLVNFRARTLNLTARLAPGVTIAQAAAAVDASERRLGTEYPMWGKGFSGQVHSFADDLVGNLRSRLFILLGAVLFVFLIACVNVANLLLARGNARNREMAIRTALGAERGRLISQLLVESAMLCLVAGACGAGLAAALVKGLVAASPPGVPRIDEVRIDGGALLFTLGISVVCAVVVGLLPALRAATPALQATLRDGARGVGESRRSERGRALLMGAEVMLAMTLLTGAALLIRTAWEISHVDPGFRSENVFTAQVLLPGERYRDLAAGARAFKSIRQEVSRTPGVVASALTSTLPLAGTVRAGIGAQGQPLTDGERFIANLRMITPGYFTTLGMRLRAGRDFAETDNGGSPNVAIINEALAARFWPGQSAMGKRFEGMSPDHQHFMEVVGIVADTRDASLDQLPTPEFYIPVDQMPAPLWGSVRGSLTIAVRTATAPATMERPVRGAIAAVDPSLPVASVATMDDLVRSSRATARFNTLLLATLGAIACLLAAVGVYGVVAYSVSQRTREVAIRMALGATPGTIGLFVVRRALTPVVVGAAGGAVLSIFATRLLREQLYGVTPGDPVTMGGIAALLIAVSVIAAGIPTRRAMRVAPGRSLGA